jgi:hypothetical protein
MPFVILPTNSASGGYDVTNSLRFNRGSSDQLTRSIGTTGNRKTATYSCWIKKCDFSNEQMFLGFTSGLNIYTNGDSFRVNSGTGTAVYSTALQRDPSAWYHFLIGIDTTQATDTNRYRLYINGTELTAFTTSIYPTQNSDLNINVSGSTQQIGSDGTSHINGYMSELYWIDGTQLTPSSFGETDFDTGIWKPKAFSGSYGTNGFYLQFKNSASLGTDSSGNGNTFTVNNLTSVDQSTDTPTNNFATLNSILYSTSISYTEGNLKFTNTSAGGQRMVASSIAPTTGKWYAECRVTSLGGNYPQIGVLDTSIYTMDTYVGALARGYGYAQHGQVYNNAGALTTGLATYTTNDIIGVALDLTNNYVYFSKNGTFINSGVPTSGSSGTGGWAITDGYDYSFGSSSLDSGTDPVFDWNFGSPFYSGGSNTDGRAGVCRVRPPRQ